MIAADDRAKATEYLESLQLRYDQFPQFDRKRYWEERHSNPVFLQHYTILKEKYPQLSWESYLSQIDSLQSGNEYIADSRYQDPNWYGALNTLIKELLPVINDDRYKSYSQNFLFGSLPMGMINAIASAVPGSNCKLILLNDGIFIFANMLAKIVATLFDTKLVDGQETVTIEKQNVLDNLEKNSDVWDKTFLLYMGYVIEGSPAAWVEQYFMNSGSQWMCNILRLAMEMFIIGHEYGHIIRGHLDDRSTIATDKTEHRIWFSQMQEFEADNVGLNIALDALINAHVGSAAGFAGADLFFLGMELLDRSVSLLQYGEVNKTVNFYGTHPPVFIRRQFIRGIIAESFDKETAADIFDFADTLEQVTERLWQKMAPAIYKLHIKGRRPHQLWSQ